MTTARAPHVELERAYVRSKVIEANLERLWSAVRPDGGHKPLHGRVGTGISEITDLSVQTHGTEFGERYDALAQIIKKRR